MSKRFPISQSLGGSPPIRTGACGPTPERSGDVASDLHTGSPSRMRSKEDATIFAESLANFGPGSFQARVERAGRGTASVHRPVGSSARASRPRGRGDLPIHHRAQRRGARRGRAAGRRDVSSRDGRTCRTSSRSNMTLGPFCSTARNDFCDRFRAKVSAPQRAPHRGVHKNGWQRFQPGSGGRPQRTAESGACDGDLGSPGAPGQPSGTGTRAVGAA